MVMFRSRIFTIAIALVAATIAAAAGERRPLPAFTVTALDGTVVESATLAQESNWLLVTVQARCAPCDTLLKQLDRDERPQAPRIAIVGIGMDQQAISDLFAKYPNLVNSRWFADPDRTAAKALGIAAQPTVFGARGPHTDWRLAGIVRDPRELESILFSWLEKQ